MSDSNVPVQQHHHEVVHHPEDYTPALIRRDALGMAIQATDRIFDLKGEGDPDHITATIVDRAYEFEAFIAGTEVSR